MPGIVVDNDAVKKEMAEYKPIPAISSFLDADGRDIMQEKIKENYRRIKQDALDIIEAEMKRIEKDEKISGKVIRESRIDLTEFMKYGEPKVQSEIFDESESRYRSLKKCYNADATKTENSTSDGADRKSLHEKSSISNLQTL